MNISYVFSKLSSERKEILQATLGSDIIRSFFHEILEEEKIKLQSLDADCSGDEFKYKFLNIKNSMNAINELLLLIDKLKKQNGEAR